MPLASKEALPAFHFLYPWANQASSAVYNIARQDVRSPWILPHRFCISMTTNSLCDGGSLVSTAVERRFEPMQMRFSTARLDWLSQELLAIFPFPHHVEMTVRLRRVDLEIQTTVFADSGSPVPISFGFHPYFGIPGIPRAEWTLNAPAMHKLALDARGIPTGQETPSAPLAARLGNASYDDGFPLSDEQATFSIAGNGYSIAIEFKSGFSFAQIFAPKDKEFVAIEPMVTAATNARMLRGGSARDCTRRADLSPYFGVQVYHHA